MLHSVPVIIACLVVLWFARLFWQFRRVLASVGGAPGPRIFFSPASLVTRLLPDIPGINRKLNWVWKEKYKVFQEFGQDVVAAITLYPSPQVFIQLADPKVLKEVLFNRSAFPKPVQFYKAFAYFGANTLTTEGEEWRVHHKVVARSFTEQNNKLVWKETVDTTLELFSLWEMEGRGDEVLIDNISAITRNIALMVISAAAFGMKLSWKDNDTPPHGHAMTFKKSLGTVSIGFLTRVILPDWILKLYPLGRDIRTAYIELGVYMREMIDNRITSPHQYEDLFSNLLKAREEEKDGESTFSDSDLMGNIFIMLFAGHETSANTLALALAFLAMYPEVQERFLAQIQQVVTPGQIPSYSDISKLSYGTAIMQETLRLIPIVPMIPKLSAYDTRFTTRDKEGKPTQIPIPAGTGVSLNFIGLHYNPTYWENPYEFKPERFLQEYEKFAWLPFSAGPRACIGRRFAEIEILAVLTLFVLKYEIRVTDEPKFASETLKERRARVLDAERATLLMHAKKTALTFKRR